MKLIKQNRRESGLKSLLKIAAIVLFAVTANAQAKKAAPAKTAAPTKTQQFRDSLNNDNGYGLAGCGLGSMAFGAKPGFIQVIAATTNGLWGNQTFGISTGTSNCDIPKMGHNAAIYIEANREVVMKDAARGEGETLSDLALIYNCSNTQMFSEKVQGQYESIFKSSNAYDSSRMILNTIKSDSALAANCNIAG